MALSSARSSRWWLEEEGTVHGALFAIADYIRESQAWQTDADNFHEQMWAGGRAYTDITDSSMSYEPSHVARNVSRQAVSTYVAKVFKHRPMPEFLANKGNWRDQRRARKLTQLIEGEFDRDKIFKKWARLVGRDSGITGRGILKVDLESTDSKVPHAERVRCKSMFVDTADAELGDPRNLYHIRTVDVGVAVERFAPDDEELADKIRASGKNDASELVEQHQLTVATVDRVRVVESWHLCDNEQAHREGKDHDCSGRHCIVVRGADLVDEVWEFDRFPVAILNYEEPLEGIFGTGICELLEGFQYEQNLMSEKVSNGHYSLGGGFILNPTGSDLVAEDFTNDTNWKEIKHAPGLAPQWVTVEPVAQGTYQYMRDLGPDALAEVGLSQMSVESKKPAGITSGVALNTMDDVETERFGMQGYAYQQWCIDVAELYVMWIRHIAKKHGDYSAKVPLRGGVLELSWKDVSVDHYIVRIHSSALMRLSPAARRQAVDDLFAKGQMDGTTYLRYLGGGEADVEAEIDVITANRLLTDEKLEAMLDAEDPSDPEAYIPPSPYTTDFAWSKARAQNRLAKAESSGCPEGNLQLVRDWILDIDALEQRASGQTGPQGVGAPIATALAPGLPGTAPGLPAPGPMGPEAPPVPPGGPLPVAA